MRAIYGKKEFPGRLEEIPPELLIGENPSDIQSFFLILGLIFNDLKGLLFFQKLVGDIYREPIENEVSVHMGEYGGLLVHLNRLTISTVGEFFKFIEKNKSILNSNEFSLILKRGRNSKFEKLWRDLSNLKNLDPVMSKIVTVRSNIVFHYDHSGKVLRRGFNEYFGKESSKSQSEMAYYSLDGTLERSRFYYSDAAAQSYIGGIMEGEDVAQIWNSVEGMVSTIQWLMRTYIDSVKARKDISN